MTLGLGLKSNMIPLYFDGYVQFLLRLRESANMIFTDILECEHVYPVALTFLHSCRVRSSDVHCSNFQHRSVLYLLSTPDIYTVLKTNLS
jgi:hypothetical protein